MTTATNSRQGVPNTPQENKLYNKKWYAKLKRELEILDRKEISYEGMLLMIGVMGFTPPLVIAVVYYGISVVELFLK